jgi:anti-sigma B factor antagonist
MCTTLVPQTCGPDHLAGCGEQHGGTRNVLTCGIHSDGQLVFIILAGELDIATAPGLDRQLSPLAETGSHLLLDLAGVQFCDCAGLSLFLRLRRRVISGGGSLHLIAPPDSVRRLIVITGLHDLLPIAAGPAEVITMLSREAATGPPRPPADDIDIEHSHTGAVQAAGPARQSRQAGCARTEGRQEREPAVGPG